MKAVCWLGGGHTESVIPQDCRDRNCFYWPVGIAKGSHLLALGSLYGRHLQSYPSVSCLFSPKPHFVYKWWLYVKTFCLSSNSDWALFSTPYMHTDKHTFNTHCSTALYIAIWTGFFCCNLNWSLYISVWAWCVQMNRISSCNFWFKYCATWRCKASCIYDLQSIWACRYVVKLYCECVNNDGSLFHDILLIFLTRHV